MTAQNIGVDAAPALAQASAAPRIDRAAAGFGVAAGLAILFNSLLAALADLWPAMDAYAARWTGHPWTTHGAADVLVFLVLGVLLTRRRFAIGGFWLALFLVVCVALAVGGFGWWVARA